MGKVVIFPVRTHVRSESTRRIGLLRFFDTCAERAIRIVLAVTPL